jgi:Glyoxalase-like domain
VTSTPLHSVTDHLIAGCRDLTHAIATIEAATGVRAAPGGTHPGKGTRNALLSLGNLRYLEVVAPDPAQPRLEWFGAIRDMDEPRLIGWAARAGDIATITQHLRDAHIGFTGPHAGSRIRPDGAKLSWHRVVLEDDANGLLPFFIEWDATSIHPSATAPAGCELAAFDVTYSDAARWSAPAAALGIDLPATLGASPHLHAAIRGPFGTISL